MISRSPGVPRISVITAVLNGAPTIGRCLASVAAQGREDVEHLVIDGGSTDGTQAILEQFGQTQLRWLSERDHGIADAFNKGIALARGECIAILNSDDHLTSGSLARSLEALDANPEYGFAFGHCRHQTQGLPDWLNLGDAAYQRRILWRMPDVNHPTWLVRRRIYQELGGYDPRWCLAMDYEYLLRMQRRGIRGILVPEEQAVMAMGGISDRQWMAACREVRDISLLYGASWLGATGRMSWYLLRGLIRRGLVGLGLHRQVDRIRALNRTRIQHAGREHSAHRYLRRHDIDDRPDSATLIVKRGASDGYVAASAAVPPRDHGHG